MRVSSNKSTINLRGPSTAVESLTAKIFAFVEQEKAEEKERGYTQTFDFPPDQARRLIGRQGGFIGELREKFDVEIQVQDGKVELKGPKAKVDRARDHIVSLGRQWADETTYTIKVDPKYHRELIGTQGATVQKLETRHKVKILFPRTAKAAKEDQSVADTASEAGRPRRNQEPDEIVIRGPKRGADEARSEILDLVNYARETSNTATVVVQEKQLPRLIGQRGAYIEEIRRDTGAKIDIPDKSGVADGVVEIKLKGTKAQVAQAKKILEEKKAILDDTVVREIEVNKKHHRALIGASGMSLQVPFLAHSALSCRFIR